MYRFIETVATAILLLLLMMFVLHLIRGDAWDWLLSKFQVGGGDEGIGENPSPPSTPNIPNDPLPPPPNQG